MNARVLATAILGALLLGACAGESIDSLSVPTETWVLADGVVDGQPLMTANGKVTLSFVDGEAIVGNATVNHYRAPVSIANGQIKHTGPLITTSMAGPIQAMELESRYLTALGDAKAIQRNGNRLTIIGDGDELHFVLEL